MTEVPSVDERGAQNSEAEGSRAISIFPSAQGQTISNLHIQAAGRDIHMQTLNLTVQYSPTVPHPQVVVEEFGNQRIAAPSGAARQRSIGFSIVDVCRIVSSAVTCWGEDRDTESSISVRSLNAGMDLPPSLVTTYAEIYVRGLLHSGHGLPCWEPQPHDIDSSPNGVVPGDVGTYTIERSFRKIFNLWEDEEAIRSLAAFCSQGLYQPLQGRITKELVLRKGETIRDGAYLTSPPSAPSPEEDNVAVVHEFLCHSTPGAILAMISSAELVATNDINAMRMFILQHAEAIYRRANSIRLVGGRESLYIITGSVKTDAWAMAAYREHMQPPHNVLQLVRNPSSINSEQTPSSSYQWTKQGSSHARLGDSSDAELNNQSIFLQGFKMALTPRFRSRVKESTVASELGFTDSAREKGAAGEDTLVSPSEGRDQSSGVGSDPVGPSSFGSWTLSLDGLNVAPAIAKPDDNDFPIAHGGQRLYTAFPPISETESHPSDFINSQLLQSTSADVALCHDDDWRFLFQSCRSDSASALPHVVKSQTRLLTVKNGVACIWPPEDGYRFLQLNSDPEPIVPLVTQSPSTEPASVPESVQLTTTATESFQPPTLLSSADEPRPPDHSSRQPEPERFGDSMRLHDPDPFDMDWGECGG